MGRTIVFDSKVEEYLSKYSKFKGVHSGLILGASTNERDIAIRLAPTPVKDDVSDIENEEEPTNLKNKPRSKITKLPIEDILDEAWMCQHAKQVTRMLPGGLDVLGIFLCGQPDFITTCSANLRQVLFSIYKSLSKDIELGFCESNNERIALQICSITNKVKCYTYDITDYKSSAKPADWKLLPHPIQWSQMDTEFHLDYWIPVRAEKSKQTLIKQIQTGLAPVYESVLSSVVLIDGKIRDVHETLCLAVNEGRKGKQKDKTTQVKKQLHTVDLFLPLAANNNTVTDPEIFECGAAMEIKGAFHSRAFVPSKCTVEAAMQAVKQDIIRSITARCEIHCEDMLFINEEQQDPSLVHELPRRVFTKLPGQDISVSDYVYHGDSAKDSLEAFQELLNLELNEEDIDTSYEYSPASQELLESDMEERLSEAGEQVMEALNSKRNIILPAISAAVVAAAMGMGYYFMQD